MSTEFLSFSTNSEAVAPLKYSDLGEGWGRRRHQPVGEDEEVGADLLPLAGDSEVPVGAPGPLEGGHHGCSSGGGGGGAGHPDICNNRQLVEGGVLAHLDK